MRKLLLVILIFLIIGSVSAHEDSNTTLDNLLGDTEYNSVIDDDLDVDEDTFIPVDVKADESWSLNVYIDKGDSTVNGELEDVDYDEITIPLTVTNGDGETPLTPGKHSIVYEFRFTNTTSIYKPEAGVSDSRVYFDFNFIRTVKNPVNSIYRFTSQFTITNTTGTVSETLDLNEINITYSDSLFFTLKGLTSAKATFYLDDNYFKSF